LEETWEASSSCVGYLVSLGDILEREGFEEIMATFVQVTATSSRISTSCYPRICHSDVVYLQGDTLCRCCSKFIENNTPLLNLNSMLVSTFPYVDCFGVWDAQPDE